MSETIKDDYGLRFNKEQNTEEMTDSIAEYILNEEIQKVKIQKALEYSEYATWERCINDWENLFEKLG